MRNFTLGFLVFGWTQLAFSQYEFRELPRPKPFPEKDWQIAFSPAALVVNLVKFEVRRKIDRRHFLGLAGGPLVGDINTNRFWDGPADYRDIGGYWLQIQHKFYLAQPSQNFLLYLEQGPFYQNANVSYDGFEFVPFEENGLTLFRPEEAELQYNSQKAGYDLVLGMEFLMDNFFVDLSLGFGYAFQMKNDGEPPNGYYLTRFTNGPNYQGLRMLPAVKFGVMF